MEFLQQVLSFLIIGIFLYLAIFLFCVLNEFFQKHKIFSFLICILLWMIGVSFDFIVLNILKVTINETYSMVVTLIIIILAVIYTFSIIYYYINKKIEENNKSNN